MSALQRRLTLVDEPANRSETRFVDDRANLADVLRDAGFALDFDCGGRGVCRRCAVPVFDANADVFAPRLACRTFVDRDDLRVDVAGLSRIDSAAPAPIAPSLPETTLVATLEERSNALGFAVDLGTTTLVCALVSLESGRILGVRTRRNPQLVFGRDVVSRIAAATRDLRNAEKMRRDLLRELGSIAAELAAKIDVPLEKIQEIVVAGNTTTQFLFCGRDVAPLGAAPFAVGVQTFPETPSRDFDWGVDFAPNARVRVFPVFSAFVGGDVLAGFARLRAFEKFGDSPQKTELFLDVGTNGESILASRGRFFATSVAAGPAFEGAEISCGSLAVPGAIRAVEFDARGAWRLQTIGALPASSVCGSGLIDAVAGALATNALAPNGRLRTSDAPELALLPDAFRRRLATVGAARAFRISNENNSKNGSDFIDFSQLSSIPPVRSVWLTQRDVRQIQLAVGAIRVGLRILLDAADRSVADLDALHLAGGFGAALNRTNARRVGLLPPTISDARVLDRGVAAALGAIDVLTRRLDWTQIAEERELVECVDLATNPRFSEIFAAETRFPTADEFRPDPYRVNLNY